MCCQIYTCYIKMLPSIFLRKFIHRHKHVYHAPSQPFLPYSFPNPINVKHNKEVVPLLVSVCVNKHILVGPCRIYSVRDLGVTSHIKGLSVANSQRPVE